MAGIPIVLVLKQPDLGTAIIMLIVLLIMLAVAGLPFRILVMLLVGWPGGRGGVRGPTAPLLSNRPADHLLAPELHEHEPQRGVRHLQPDPGQEGHRFRAASSGPGSCTGPRPTWATCPSSRPTSSSPPWGSSWVSSAPSGCWPSSGSSPGGSCTPPASPATCSAACLHRALLLRGLQRVPERRHDHGHHADHRYPAPLRQLRRYGGTVLLRGDRAGAQRRRPAEAGMTDVPADPTCPIAPGFRVMDVDGVSLDLPGAVPDRHPASNPNRPCGAWSFRSASPKGPHWHWRCAMASPRP